MNWAKYTFPCVLFLLSTSLAHAGWEVSLYGGVSLPFEQYMVHHNDAGTTLKWEGVQFHDSAVVGGGLTYWRPGLVDLGLQLEASHFNVNVKNQSNTRGTTQHGTLIRYAEEDLNPAHTDVTTTGLNLLIRVPLPYLQPFLGVGGGAAFADNRQYNYYYEHTSASEDSDLSVSPYWQLLGGVRVPFGNWALFTEYKLIGFETHFHYKNWTVDNYNRVQQIIGGLSVSF